jgi:hypothetical protein
MIELLDSSGNVIGYYDGNTGDTTPIDASYASVLAIWGSAQWNSQGQQPYSFADGTQAVVPDSMFATAYYQTTGVVTPPAGTASYLTPAQQNTANTLAASQGLTPSSTNGLWQTAAGALMKYQPNTSGTGSFVPYTGSSISPMMLLAIGAVILVMVTTPPRGGKRK